MKIFNLIPITLFILFYSNFSSAIQILQAKGDKVLLNLEGETVEIDQKLFILNASNKKIALAAITQSKNGKAIAQVTKGKIEGAQSIQLIKAGGANAASSATGDKTEQDGAPYRLHGMKVSGLFNLAMNSMTVKQNDGTSPVPNEENVAMSGMGFGLTGAVDYPLWNWLIARGTLGYEPFSAAGTSKFLSCDSLTSTSCNATMQYLTGGGYARYDFTNSKYLIWGGIGATAKFPLGKSTTALKTEDIKLTITMALAGGIDYYLNNKNFIPASLEYQIFQSSSTVSANIMLIRAGYGWAF